MVLKRIGKLIKRPTPVTIGVDLVRMGPGGQNGGIKPHLLSFLRAMENLPASSSLRFIHFVSPAMYPEMKAFARPSDPVVSIVQENPALPTSTKHSGNQPFATTVTEWLSQNRLDVLYAPFGNSEFFSPEHPAVSLIVDCLHRDLPEMLPPAEVAFREQWFQRVFRNASVVQTISDFTASRLKSLYEVEDHRIFVTHLPVHERLGPAKQHKKSATLSPANYFLYPANYWPHKNHETLLVAYRLYRRKHLGPNPPADLVFTGFPDDRESALKALAQKLHLGDTVHFLGHIPNKEFANVFRQATALVFPSLYEGFGIPLAEAMHFGVPVAASQTAAIPEVTGDAALLFEPRNPSAIATALLRIESETSLRTTLLSHAQSRLRSWSLEKEARSLLTRLLELAKQKENR